MAKKANKAKRGKDKYYHLAKEQGYRARSAFKLIQLNKKYDFLAKSHTLVDLCAAPGGWLQVAAKYMPSASTIVGVDLMPIKAIRGVITHTEDITTPQCRTLLKKDLMGRKADVILHDGAPNVGQNWAKDAFGQSELVLHSLKLATEFLRPKGMFVTKVFRSADYNSLMWVFQQLFDKVEATKPHSSRNASAEIFVVCRDYKAPAKIDPRLLDLKYVFKDVEPTEGTGKGMAGGGGTGTVDVMHKKGNRERHREGYDEALGPLLTRRLSILAFITTHDPLRILTDISAFDFDKEAEVAGVTALPITTQEIKLCCADLKVLGKKEFKSLMKWRLAVRHSLPDIVAQDKAKRKAERRKANGEEEEEEAGGEEGAAGEDTMDEEEGEGKPELDSDEEAEAAAEAELSAVASDELRRRKREEKRKTKARQLAIKKNQLGMNLRSVDMLYTDDSLFNVARLKRYAAARGLDAEEALADLADGDMDEGREDGDAEDANDEVDDDGLSAAEKGPGDEEELGDGEEDEEEGEDEDEVDVAARAAGTGKLFDTLKARAKSSLMDTMEDELETTYVRMLANRARVEAEARQRADTGKRSHGIKLTRRAKLEQQALLTEAALNSKLDAEHTKYLQLLAGAKGSTITSAQVSALARKRARAADSDAESEEADILEDDAGDAEAMGAEEDEEEDAGRGPGRQGGSGASAPAGRWFARAEFKDALPGGGGSSGTGASLSLAAAPTTGKGKHSIVEESDSEDERARGVVKRAKPTAPASGKNGGKRSGEVDEGGNPITVDKDGDAFPDWMASVPKSDRDKRKDKLRKDREREEKRLASAKALEEEEGLGAFKTVAGLPGVADDEFEAVAAAAASKYDMDEEDDEKKEEKNKHAAADAKRRELIKAGMGRVQGSKGAAAGVGKEGFEVVPAEVSKAAGKRRRSTEDDSDDDSDDDSVSSAESSPDPRLENYDSDEHAELMALGKALKRHSTAKALLDASYNRYAFDDSAHALPQWFASDERSHFRPQLPIPKSEVDAIKAKFRDIAARPVHKVAEARARKKRRLEGALDKARKKAAGILDQEELGPRSKEKEIAKAYRTAAAREKKKVVTQVNRHGKKVGTVGKGGKGTRTRNVDTRMKKEVRAAKRKDKHAKGKNASRRRNGK